MRLLFIIFSLVGCVSISLKAQNNTRLESEYKLAIPEGLVEDIFNYLQTKYLDDSTKIANVSVKGEASVETFKDIYFDDSKNSLFNHEVGLRHRSRYKDGILLKELIQLKTPKDQEGVIRSEIKFDVDKKLDNSDFLARHPLVKFIRKKDRDELRFLLNAYDTSLEELAYQTPLTQKRSRIYLADSLESIATITLDEVRSNQFPITYFDEMEIELNEIRYTLSNPVERQKMDQIGDNIKKELIAKYPQLKMDQTPKYNKLKQMIDANWMNVIWANYMWIIFGVLLLIAIIKIIK